MADDADDLAVQVEHGPARIALVDGGICLEELGQRDLGVDRVRLVPAAHISHGQRVGDAVGGAHDEDLFPDLDNVRVAHRGRLDAGGDAGELEKGEVGPRLGRDDARRRRLTAQEVHRDLVGDLHDVGRRQHLAVARDQHARADLIELDEDRAATLRGEVFPLGSNQDHRSVDALERRDHTLRLDGGGEPPQSATHFVRSLPSKLSQRIGVTFRNQPCNAFGPS